MGEPMNSNAWAQSFCARFDAGETHERHDWHFAPDDLRECPGLAAPEGAEEGAAQAPADEALAGEVWQESDGVLLLCMVPGKTWRSFSETVPWDAPGIAYPLTRLVLADGSLDLAAAESRGAGRDVAAFRSSALALIEHHHPHAADSHPEGACETCDYAFAIDSDIRELRADKVAGRG